MGQLRLNSEQDGMGYFYGQYKTDDGNVIRVDILPPKSEPKPFFVMALPPEQHTTDWIVYANGEEIARVKRREDLDTLDIQPLLPAD
jgi:hypothetical protein